MILFLIFIIIPLIEICLFVTIGDEIGVFYTLLLCVFTALAGSILIRMQGLQAFHNAQKSMEQRDMPMGEIFDGFCLLIAGFFLITPGFFTDSIGFALLVPAVRRKLRAYLSTRIKTHVFGASASSSPSSSSSDPQQNADIIDGEYEVLEDKKIEPKPQSNDNSKT